MEYILKTKNLRKTYGKTIALDELSMNVPKGSIYGFVGKNGAGKTTLIRLVCGLQYPIDGELKIYNVKHDDIKINNIRKKMGAVVETPSIYPDKTAYENLKIQFDILGLKNYEKIDELLKLVKLDDTGKKIAKDFSLGMRQRLGIAVALCGNSEFLILDEPTNGLDPEGIVEMRNLLTKLNKERNITILISSHILDELSRVATHYGFIKDGKMVKEISAEEFEKECKHTIKLEVDSKDLEKVLKKEKYNYKLISSTQAELYGNIEITPLVLNLHKENINVIKLTESEESLENYFFNLLGGDNND
ncbi:MAG: ATP-binding cassette domain-containing protein [Bacilli bacterium]|nr:ATP-binding cassette domain-containing protein [Bacilli bacterium]